MKQNVLDYVPIKRKLEERSPSKQFQQEFQASDDGSILFIKQIKTEKAFLDFLKEWLLPLFQIVPLDCRLCQTFWFDIRRTTSCKSANAVVSPTSKVGRSWSPVTNHILTSFHAPRTRHALGRFTRDGLRDGLASDIFFSRRWTRKKNRNCFPFTLFPHALFMRE